MSQKILLVNPPFTQLNTPYPATAYLKGFLNTQNVSCAQMDLGLETILRLFSKNGLIQLFEQASQNLEDVSENAFRIYSLRESYINTIDAVIGFLQDDDPTLSHFICERNFLPEASKFEQMEDLEWAFGSMGIRDKARHLATLYLEDISDFIVELVDPHFGFSRYAERLGISANSFDELHEELHAESSLISEIMLSILEEKIEVEKPTLVCLSVPFPGNLFAALKCGQWLKKNHPNITIAMGGGFPNTELRSLADPRVFKFVDFITLDDGEVPLTELLAHLNGNLEKENLKRTFTLVDGEVKYLNGSVNPDIKQEKVGTPDYAGLPLKKYLSVIQLTNPMHRLWSDGRWNKLTIAHGCYWGKCTFCDISLDYIKNYEGSSATLTVDRMEQLIAQTGERGFHFVDEAAPPALMKAIALEILKRKLVVTWWANIRFEKSFNYDLCRLLAASGCIAISGGLEVASDRLLKLIAKGVSIEQVAKVNENFNRAGIMVHAYLMYGFPTQTAQETIDSLEVVRQMFELNVMQSAFWHRFAMTAHSPVGLNPEKFKVKAVNSTIGAFANNDLQHEDPTGANHDQFGEGLKKSLFNYMHGIGFELPLQDWFDDEVPETSLPPDLIEGFLAQPDERALKQTATVTWLGGPVTYNISESVLSITTKQETIHLECPIAEGQWLSQVLNEVTPTSSQLVSLKMFEDSFQQHHLDDFESLWESELMEELREIGLLVL
ncbi:MAG TPA: radical SAM protein [Flavobacteriales bacterium]|nr:radical SAM protein [Flavobacteriales bacterium]